MLDLSPGMANEVSPAQSDFCSAARLGVHRQLSQTALHTIGDPYRNFQQRTTEVPQVELSMQLLESMEESQIARAWPVPPLRSLRGGNVGMNRKIQELSLGMSPEHAVNSRVQKPNDGLQYAVGSKCVASVDAEYPPAQAQHHGAVGVRQDALNIPQTQCL
jgi:hypothetical protein